MALVLCGGCARHVREIEPRCPFCGHARVASEHDEPSIEGPTRLSRAAILLAGAVSMAACQRTPPIAQPYGAPPRVEVPDTGALVEPTPVAADGSAPDVSEPDSAIPEDAAAASRAVHHRERARPPTIRPVYGAPAAAYGASPEFKRTDED
ncbi:MAG: hypothetical protein U0269_38200 [Polyangiales bacterium]